jgi:hypothetical protein
MSLKDAVRYVAKGITVTHVQVTCMQVSGKVPPYAEAVLPVEALRAWLQELLESRDPITQDPVDAGIVFAYGALLAELEEL